MKHIEQYNNPAEYAADASNRPSGESFAGVVGQRPVIQGVNVIRPWAERAYADAIFYDKLMRERVVIKAGTINLEVLDTDRYFNCKHAYIGQVYGREFALARSCPRANMPRRTNGRYRISTSPPPAASPCCSSITPRRPPTARRS